MNCPTGKVEHQAVTAAQAHADSIFRKDGHQPNVYVCSQCGFFHVGGGRASDRPAHRPVPIVTKARPVFVQKKIDKGKQRKVEDLVLEKLRTTFLTDIAIAKALSISWDRVCCIRMKHKIPNSFQRAQNAVADLLVVDPSRPRKEIAEILRVKYTTVTTVVTKLGLANTATRGGPKGVNHPLFGKSGRRSPSYGKLVPEETRKKISAGIKKAYAGMTPKRREAIASAHRGVGRSPETRAKIGEASRGRIFSAETRAKISAAHKGRVFSEERCRKMSEARKGRVLTEEHRSKIKEGLRRRLAKAPQTNPSLPPTPQSV